MSDLLFIACGTGLQDGLSPCVMMSCAVFIVYSRWLISKSLPFNWLCFIFGLTYAVGILGFNFGIAPVFVLQKYFMLSAKIIYLVLGAGAFVLGVLSFKDWLSLKRAESAPVEDPAGHPIKILSVAGAGVCLLTVVLAAALSGLATVWPMNKYIIVLGNEALLRGAVANDMAHARGLRLDQHVDDMAGVAVSKY